jgi:hypothetical protein
MKSRKYYCDESGQSIEVYSNGDDTIGLEFADSNDDSWTMYLTRENLKDLIEHLTRLSNEQTRTTDI